TYGGNPVACAAALAALATIRSDGLVTRAAAIGETVLPRLRALQAEEPHIGDVRGRGAMLAVEFVRPGTVEPDPATTKAVAAAAHQAGLIVLTCGSWGNVVRLLPPLAIGDDLLAEALDVFTDVIRSCAR
ncbi:MAG: aminotransferase class III-fold pyridoxal phosphate-dependent enzyme, partial [Pseudonocardia sp.]|nr:aminotransferase class III-fold pyridoxal phosphate-dependent enzyme [Pseudonocardia sp.]